MHGEKIGHRRECQIYRRPARGAESPRLHIAAVADDVPMRRFAFESQACARERQVGSMTGAALALTVATLAVVHHERFGWNFIADRPAGASAGIRLAHVSLLSWHTVGTAHSQLPHQLPFLCGGPFLDSP